MPDNWLNDFITAYPDAHGAGALRQLAVYLEARNTDVLSTSADQLMAFAVEILPTCSPEGQAAYPTAVRALFTAVLAETRRQGGVVKPVTYLVAGVDYGARDALKKLVEFFSTPAGSPPPATADEVERRDKADPLTLCRDGERLCRDQQASGVGVRPESVDKAAELAARMLDLP